MVALDITDANGRYHFANLLPGDYYVEFVLPADYRISPLGLIATDGADSNVSPDTGRTVNVTLVAGEDNPTWDAGIYPVPTAIEDGNEPLSAFMNHHLFLPLVAKR